MATTEQTADAVAQAATNSTATVTDTAASAVETAAEAVAETAAAAETAVETAAEAVSDAAATVVDAAANVVDAAAAAVETATATAEPVAANMEFLVHTILGILVVLAVFFLYVFLRDYFAKRNQPEAQGNLFVSGAIGFVTNFFDTLGIGSFAPTTALLKFAKQCPDRLIPGTLNVSCTIPVIAEALIFIGEVKVEPITLFSMLVAAAVGAYFGAGIISRFSEQRIRLIMGVALFVTAVLMIFGQLGLMPAGGDAIGLTGGKLIFAVVANFVLGVLMTAGIGLYAPCLALVYFLGMSPLVAFPIMMGSCAVLMPVASARFVKEGAYSRVCSMGIMVAGVVGVWIAATIVQSMDIALLTKLVIAVIFYTSGTMLYSYYKGTKQL